MKFKVGDIVWIAKALSKYSKEHDKLEARVVNKVSRVYVYLGDTEGFGVELKFHKLDGREFYGKYGGQRRRIYRKMQHREDSIQAMRLKAKIAQEIDGSYVSLPQLRKFYKIMSDAS